MLNPLVSVVMPAYNSEKYIEQAIQSILNQTYVDLELIVVEDCSTDDTAIVLSVIDDNRIKYLKNEKNKGISYSTNKAISMSSGKYIALMDDDDIAMPDRLQKQVDYLESHENIDILGGASEIIDEKGNHKRYSIVPRNNPKYIKAMLLFKCLDFRNGTGMIRKRFLEDNNLKYREGYFGMQDYQLFIESSKVGQISSIPDILIKYREHDLNETKKQIKYNNLQREKVYAEMRRQSLEKSGYILSAEQYSIIDKALTETKSYSLNREELDELYGVFTSIYNQAKRMNVDYLIELEIVLKRLLADQVYKAEIFT